MAVRSRFLWLDLETTGLDPLAPGARVLEWAAVLADDALETLEPYSSAVYWPDALELFSGCDEYVRDMHTRNGLWAEVADPARSAPLADGEDLLLALLPPRGLVHLAGASVHFDLGWLRVHMPRLAKRLHHRILDVTSLWLAAQAWGPPGIDRDPSAAHRALDDILQTIADARRYRAAMGWTPKEIKQ